jgi:single-stranded-DNA-specific exonuclease
MSHAEESLRLLTTSSEQEAEFLARRLEDLNLERRRLTEQGFTAARQQVESLPELPPILVVTDPIITPGVAGLVAGRLAELYGRPGVVMADIGEDRLVASGRSVPGFNLVESFAACADLFVRYGGHAQAAGFTVERDQVHPLRDRLNGLAADAFARQPQETDLELDARLELADLNPGLVEWLGRLEPFGVGNPAPMFLVSGLQVVENRRVGATGQHLRLRVRQGGRQCTALAFNQADRWPNVPSTVDIAGSVLVDHWNGMETVNLKIADLRSATS